MAAPEQGVLDIALAHAESLIGKDAGTLGAIKSTMFAAVVTALNQWAEPPEPSGTSSSATVADGAIPGRVITPASLRMKGTP